MKKHLLKSSAGFSLIELIVSLALLAILSLALVGFLSSGTSTYSSLASNISLQLESQITLSQIREYIIDCNGGICYSESGANKTIYVLSQKSGDYTVHVFTFDSASGTLYYSSNPVTNSGSGYTMTAGEKNIISTRVTGLDLSLSQSGGALSSAAVTVSFAQRNRTYTGSETIALRNSPSTAASIDALLGGLGS